MAEQILAAPSSEPPFHKGDRVRSMLHNRPHPTQLGTVEGIVDMTVHGETYVSVWWDEGFGCLVRPAYIERVQS